MDIRLSLFSVFFALAACGNGQLGDIKDEYSNSVRRQGMIPIYPPREDVQVGDVYLFSVPKRVEGVDPDVNDVISLFVGSSTKVAELAEDYLKTRQVLQQSVNYTEDGNASRKTLQDDLFSGNFSTDRDGLRVLRTRAMKDIKSLPIEPFPSIQADAGIAGTAGIVRLLQAFGFGISQRTSVTLDVNDVRTLGTENIADTVSIQQEGERILHETVNKFGDNATHGQIENLVRQKVADESARRKLTIGPQHTSIEKDLSKRCFKGFVVNKVYYTRRIDYTYSNQKIAAAAIKAAKPLADGETPQAGNVHTPDIQIINVTHPNAADQKNAENVNATLTGLQTSVVNAVNSGVAGDGLTFQNWSVLGVRFARNFQRPVAVAYEGIEFTIGSKFGAPTLKEVAKVSNLSPEETVKLYNQKYRNSCDK